MEQNEIQIPEIAEEQKGKKTWIVAAGILAACFIIVAVIFVIIVKIYNTDERKLLKGVVNLAEEVEQWDEIWEKETGNHFVDMDDKSKTTTIMNISSEDIPITIGVDVEALQDMKAKRVQTSMTLSVTNTDLAEVIVYGDEEQMMISTPDFWKQILVFETENIGEQYNNSRWVEMFGPLDEELLSPDFFDETDEKTTEIDIEQLVEKWKSLQENGLTIEKLEEKVDIDVSDKNNMIYDCNQYRVTVPQELTESLIELEEVDIVSDIMLLVAMDKNNQIMQLNLEEPVQLTTGVNEEIELSGDVMFLGKERSIDDTIVRLEWNIPMGALMTDEKVRETLKENRISVDSLPDIDIVTNGNITFDENDVSVVTNLEELTITVDSLGTYKIRGTVEVEPLKESIQPLEGEKIQLFEMTDAQYEDLQNQFWKNLNKWIEAIESIY